MTKLSLADLIGAILLYSSIIPLSILVLFLESYLAKNDVDELRKNLFPMTEVKYTPHWSLPEPKTVPKKEAGNVTHLARQA